MLTIRKEIIAKLRAATSVEEVRTMLNGAIALEFSTIPPYLTALFSIKAGNREARALVHSIVIEEMLHMTLAANTLIAIGGDPAILRNAQQSRYPGPLPMCVDEALTVTLASLTRPHIGEVFMAIERPATNAVLPGEARLAAAAAAQVSYDSIGDFYAAVIDKLAELVASGQPIFEHPRLERQIDIGKWFPPEIERFPHGKVSSLESARAVLDTIVRQGEGFRVGKDKIDPKEDPSGNYAHYFKFGEIFYGHRLVPDPANPSGWSYSGDDVPLDERNIINVVKNAALSDYPPDSGAYVAGKQFYDAYQSLLLALDQTFNGHPEQLVAALGVMFELKLVAQQVMQFEVGFASLPVYAAPPFMLTRAVAQ